LIQLTFAQIAQAVNGQLIALNPETVFSGEVKSNSKQIKPGDLFVAIEGEKFDGHDYVQQAIEAGACAAVVSKKIANHPQVLVSDASSAEFFEQATILALGRLARQVHRSLTDLTTIAITGSSGKTSTKDIIAQLGSLIGETIYTQGSENNEIGLPLTVLNCTTSTKLLVLEMGARRIGNIAYLADIAKPNLGIITHIGSAHLEIFGSEENLIKGKSEIISKLNVNDYAIINFDDKKSIKASASTKAKIFSFAIDQAADLTASNINFDNLGFAHFSMNYKNEAEPVQLKLVGKHNIYNALAAAAAYLLLGVNLKKIAELINQVEPLSKWRMQFVNAPNEVLIVNDAYNANPESMQAALLGLKQILPTSRKIAILGEMKELGEHSSRAHRTIGSYVAQLGIDHLLVVGKGARDIFEEAVATKSWIGSATFHENIELAGRYAKELIASKDVVLVKASRSVGLEVLVDQLLTDLRQK
jgi:UDP-N-acetylmuramoyl-tripeptide--D-alanyl-D-alanine ligase